jgi:predicted nucleic acid-binding Zn ribbon protein
MEQRVCKECGHKLSGRKDQKFCSDYCRNSFNNKLNEDANASVRKTDEF